MTVSSSDFQEVPHSSKYASLVAGIALTFAYIVTGKLALMLALPPGYASAIFPPAGIAVAAAFIGGNRTLPWTFLGSLLLNLWVSYVPAHAITTIGALAAILIALASMLQAMAGGWWLKRAIGYPAAFDNANDVLRFLLLAPAICLISASLSVSSLTLIGILDATQIAPNWAAWWIGDTLGVLVMLPLVFVLVGEPRELWRKREYSVAVPMLLAFTLFVFVFVKANSWEQDESLMEFRAMSDQIADQIQTRFEEQESLLEQVDGFFSHDLEEPVTREEFHRFVSNPLNRFSAIQAVEWAPRVEHAQRSRFEAAHQVDYPGFEIREGDAAGQLRRAINHADYYPLAFVEPVDRNRVVLGYDLASEMTRRQALDTAHERGIPVATAPLRLVQEPEQQFGILLMQAVKRGGSGRGVALTVLRVADFIDKTLPRERSLLQLRMTDSAAQQIVYNNFGETASRAQHERFLNYGTREYRLEFVPSQFYLMQHRGWQSWSVLAVGLFGTSLLGALLLLATGYTARVESQVADRSAALRKTEAQLKEAQHMAKIGSWELDLVHNVLTWSDEIYRIFEIDPMVFGASYEAFLRAIHPEDRARVDQAYKDSLDSRMPYTIDHRLLLAGGRIKHVHERCETFYAQDGTPLRSIGTVQDITVSKLSEEALRESEERFKTVADYNYDWEYWRGADLQMIYISPSCERITGYTPKEFIDDPGLLERIVLAQDRHLMESHLTSFEDVRECSIDFRIRRKDGGICWIAHGCRPIYGKNGEFRGRRISNRDITERKAAEERIQQLAYYDTLTDLPNRRLLMERVKQALSQAVRHERSMAVMFLDLDRFKDINDTLGHEAGDSLLIAVARRLNSCVRTGDTVSRQGGDEFVIVLAEIHQLQDAAKVAEKIIEVFADPVIVEGKTLRITTSIGISVYSGSQADDTQELLRKADSAMYVAKDAGGNGYRFYQD